MLERSTALLQELQERNRSLEDSQVSSSLVDVHTFAESPEYLGQPKLGERQVSILERFFTPNSPYSELVLLWGKGSGKDHLAGIIILYMTYLNLELPDPQATYGLPPGASIDFVNVAQSAKQAKRVFFEGSLKPKLKHSPYFRKVGYVALEDLVKFPKNIRAISTHSQNESYEGFNVLGFVMDEAAAFRSETRIANADKIYNTLRTSMVSRFPHAGKGCILSYPRHENDFIMRKYRDAEKHAWILADKGCTWEINPLRSRQDFDTEYERDPIDAAAKYECLPPLVEDSFLPPDHLEKCFTGINQDPTSLPVGPRYVVSLDPAIYADRFAIVIGHKSGKVIVDSVQFIKGDRKKPVLISDIETNVSAFCKRTSARIITDSHEIVGSVQKWQREGIKAEIVGVAPRLQMEHWTSRKNVVIAQTIQLPNEPELSKELTRLQVKRSGDLWKVEAAEGEFDDLSDATARLVWSLNTASTVDLSNATSWRIK